MHSTPVDYLEEYRKIREEDKHIAAHEIKSILHKYGMMFVPIVTIKGTIIESDVVLVEDPKWKPEKRHLKDSGDQESKLCKPETQQENR
jgi:hypothetical protein